MYNLGYITYRALYSQPTDLIVGPEPSLPGIGPRRAITRGRGTNSSIRGVAQGEGVSILWKSNNELLSWDSIVLQVIHDIVL